MHVYSTHCKKTIHSCPLIYRYILYCIVYNVYICTSNVRVSCPDTHEHSQLMLPPLGDLEHNSGIIFYGQMFWLCCCCCIVKNISISEKFPHVPSTVILDRLSCFAPLKNILTTSIRYQNEPRFLPLRFLFNLN